MTSDESPGPEVSPNAAVWEKRLWDAANAIVGFALAQSLVAAYALGKEDLKKNLADDDVICACIALLLAVTAAQVLAVCFCRWWVRWLPLDQTSSRLWTRLTIGRSLAILFFSVAPLFGLIQLLHK